MSNEYRRAGTFRQGGAALMIVLLFFFASSVAVVIGATAGINRELRSYQSLSQSKFSYYAAESAVEDAVYRLREDMDIGSSITIVLNGATSSATVNTIDASHKTVTAIGDANARFRTMELDISKSIDGGTFNYAAQIGGGGVTLSGSGSIIGDMIAGGPVTSSGSGSFQGNVTATAATAADASTKNETCETDQIVGDSDLSGGNQIDHAQSFVAPLSGKLTAVHLYMKRVSTPVDPTIRITTDNAGSPNTSAIASETYDRDVVDTNYTWVTVPFGTPATLTMGQTYWIVVDSGSHATRYLVWCRSNADVVAGAPKYKQTWSTGGAWTNIAGDLDYRVVFASGTSTYTGGGSGNVTGTLKADTIDNETIGGNAYYQAIDDDVTVSGTKYPGSATPPPVPMPISDSMIAQWKADAEAGGTYTGNYTHSSSGNVQFGPKKITGNLTLSGSGDFKVTGTLYVQGYVSHSGSGKFQCDPLYGTNSCVIVTDSYIRRSGSGAIQGSGTAGSYILLLTTTENCYGSGSPGPCAGSDDAIASSGSGSSVIFYSTDGQINISGSGGMNAIAGYKLIYSGSADVTYDPNLLNVIFAPDATNTDAGEWTINTWKEKQN